MVVRREIINQFTFTRPLTAGAAQTLIENGYIVYYKYIHHFVQLHVLAYSVLRVAKAGD